MNTSTSAFLQKQALASPFWQGAALYEQCIAAGAQHPQQADFLYAYGYEFLGMAYSVYVHKVIEKISQFGIDHVMFVAREGYLFQKIYEVFTGYHPTAVHPEVTTCYAYMSRVSTFLASTPHLTTRELVLTTDKPGQQGLWSTLKTLGLPPAVFAPFAEAHRVDMRSPTADYWNDANLLNFFSDKGVQAKVREYHQQAHATLYQYLRQCNFWGADRKVALVDIGWEGTIQDNLVRAFNQLGEFPLLHGLYFGRRERKTFLKYSNAFSHGLIYESRNRNVNTESIDIFVEIFEKGAGAPHASTRGYEPIGAHIEDGVRPIFKSASSQSRQAEISANASIAAMQQGILDFVHQYAQRWQQQGFTSASTQPFAEALITRHIAFPTHKEAYQVTTQLGQQAEDLGEDKLASLAVTAQEFWPPLKRGDIKTPLKLFKGASWRPGTFRLIKIPGLLALYRLKRFLSF